MTRSTKLGGIVLVLLLRGTAAHAWGPDGHQIVCEIAFKEAKAGRRVVTELMAGDPDDGSFASACNWPDRIRDDHRWDWAKPLHFVNIPPAKSFDPKFNCLTKGCAARAVGQYARAAIDQHAPIESRRRALKFLGHFVGDLHQPLHVSYPEDQGGNAIETKLCTSECRNLKLHSLWDSGIIKEERTSWQDLAASLQAAISDEDRRAWRETRATSMTAESFALAETRAYHAVRNGSVDAAYIGDLDQPVKLDTSYVDAMKPVIRRQLQTAGVRLAAILDALAEGHVPPELEDVPPLYATPSEAVGRVLFVREQPTRTSRTIVSLHHGDRVEILGEVGHEDEVVWYVVRLPSGRDAYVRADYADVVR